MDGGVGEDKRGIWQVKMEKITTATKNILLRDKGVHHTAVSTHQYILHIYIYKVFPNSLVFVLKITQRCLVKLSPCKTYFLGDIFKTAFKFMYIQI